MADEEAPKSAKGKSRRLGKQAEEDALQEVEAGESEAPKSAKGEAADKRPAKFLPYTGKSCIPAPAGYATDGRPLDKDKKPFKSEVRFAVEEGTLVEYRRGRGGVKKRSKVSLKLSESDQREKKSNRYDYIKKLRAQLKSDGVPGA